jgi:glutathione S-transferase
MIKIFHTPLTRSLRVVWLCEEMGIDYEISPVEMQNKSAEFLAVNPSGTLPAIVDGEQILTESVAILQYLTETRGPTPLAVKPGAPNYADYIQFLIMGEAGLASPLNAIFGCRFFGEPQDLESFAVKVISDGFLNRLQLVTRQLEKGPYMAGSSFTAADISIAYTVGLGLFLEFGDRMPASVHDYYKRCTERPAFQRAASVK